MQTVPANGAGLKEDLVSYTGTNGVAQMPNGDEQRSVQGTDVAVREPVESAHGTKSAVCFLSWEIDGREVLKTQDDPTSHREKRESPRGLTRRIHLRWTEDSMKDSYLVFVATGKGVTASDAERAWNPNLLFLGREIGIRGNIQARVKSWLDLCYGKHQGPCLAPPQSNVGRFYDMLSHSYFGVIDVLNMQLTELPMQNLPGYPVKFRGYVALSYVWGESPAYRTVLGNVMQHRVHGGLDRVLHDLPKVIQDAIELVRRLGIQYLWVDALCIVQDSARSWNLNAYNMDLIYGHALFTICAADGPSASTGLLAMHSQTGTGTADQLIADCTEDVRLVVSRPPEMYIRSSMWNTRAWTFQERLLSRRCLIFTGSRVYFQCHSTGMSEDIYADREGAGWSLDFMDAPLQTFRQLPLRSIWVYMKSVELYTARELSSQADIIAAFSGVSNLMAQTMQAPFVFGLPTSHFDLALLWTHLQPVQRRKCQDNLAEGEFTDFPSWSWSGWLGTTAQYRREMIEGRLDNVNEWLEERTWVRWYTRDSKGDLRPLWDQNVWRSDLSEHEKWKGYGGNRSSGSTPFWTRGRGRRSPIITHESPRPSRDRNDEDPKIDWIPSQHQPVSSINTYIPSDDHTTTVRRTRRIQTENMLQRGVRDRKAHENQHKRDHPRRNSELLGALLDATERPEDVSTPLRKVDQAEVEIAEQPPAPLDTPWRSYILAQTPPFPQAKISPFSSQVPQSSTMLQQLPVQWVRFHTATTRWARLAYRNEIVRFLVDVCVAMLRLLAVLLGMPVERAPNGNIIQRPSIPPSVFDFDKFGLSPLLPRRDSDMPPSESPAGFRSLPQDYERYIDQTTGRPIAETLRASIISKHPNSHITHDPGHRGQEQVELLRNLLPPPSSKSNTSSFGTVKTPHSAMYSTGDNGHGPLDRGKNLAVKRVRYDKSARSIEPSLQMRSIQADNRRAHDLVFQPDTDVEPEHTELCPQFHISLKEYPYRPVIAPYDPELGSPRLPIMSILQFWTWHTFLHIQSPSPTPSTGLIQCNLADNYGDWCGSITLDARWVNNAKRAKQEFVSISEAKKFTDEECKTWSYYVPKEREESEWDLFYVLLIAWSDGRWERVGLGKAFKEAFRDATWKEIVLA